MWHIVYVIKNGDDRQHIGSTPELALELIKHNKGEFEQTANDRPWKLTHAAAFPSKEYALNYQKYLQSDTGERFLRQVMSEKNIRSALNS